MLKLYDLETAKKTILRRDRSVVEEYSSAMIEGNDSEFTQGTTPSESVTQILDSVRTQGDKALRHWTESFDGKHVDDFRVPLPKLASSLDELPAQLRDAMATAAKRIRAFHNHQPIPSWTTKCLGGVLGQRLTPIRRVGIYVPGGSAPLPSSLLMSVIPAQVAGVQKIIVCTPPQLHPTILAAANLCKLDTVFTIGGAQAIAAMAFGTETVPRVDKIVGAGGIYVTLAKRQVFGYVGIDGLAGPTETMIIADSSANPSWVAADLLAQAEHDPMATAILLTSDVTFAEATQHELEHQLVGLSRREIIVQALEYRSGVVLTPDLETSALLADEYAPEHLCLYVADPELFARRIQNAGGIFMGDRSFEVLGDYTVGPSHVMPTGGTARYASPLNVLDFLKITSMIMLDPVTSSELSVHSAIIAHSETLTAHAAAAELRLEADDD